ncbi:MAG: hypothetical protein AAF490_18105 [Chloroflexota bacterium]
MKITEDIIIDLLPVYQSGEASEDTKKLIEAYIEQNPDFKKMLLAFDNKLEFFDIDQPESKKIEKEALMRVKKILRTRSTLLGLALFLSLMPLSNAGNSEEGLTWLMFRDAPNVAILFGVLALIMWIAYAWTFKTLSD